MPRRIHPIRTTGDSNVEGVVQPGGQVDGYRIEALLGRGGEAAVYRAHRAEGTGVVALKVLDEEHRGDLAPGGRCPFLGQEAWISALGRFDPCCAPDAQRRTLGEFGDLNREGLMQIWDGERYRELLATYRNRALCLGCNMRQPVEVP